MLSDAEFATEFEREGPYALARRLKRDVRNIYRQRVRVEHKLGRQLTVPKKRNGSVRQGIEHPHRVHLEVQSGTVLIGADAHYWPGKATTAHRAFVKLCKELEPAAVIMNGDAFDGARVSRHAPIGWEKRPEVIQELEAVQERLGEIELATKARLIWPLGNHDGRFETRLATVAPEYAHIHGMHLKDHVGGRWEPCWAAWINSEVVVKHRYKGGIHAAYNNTMGAGKSIITGHLHRGVVTPFSDYGGTRYGVDLPCLADPYGDQFLDYTEDNPRNQRAGFCVLTFRSGVLLPPELAFVHDADHIAFRGELIRV